MQPGLLLVLLQPGKPPAAPIRALCTLVHFGAVVADAPSPLSTPRSAALQAQLRLGKPLRKKCRASPDAIRHAGRVVAGTLGLSELQSLFHGEHDAQEPTKVKRGQGGGRASALAPEL